MTGKEENPKVPICKLFDLIIKFSKVAGEKYKTKNFKYFSTYSEASITDTKTREKHHSKKTTDQHPL